MKRFTTLATLAVCCGLALQAAPALAGNKAFMKSSFTKSAMLPRSTAGFKVANAPIVRDHRGQSASSQSGFADSGAVVRDHRTGKGLLDTVTGGGVKVTDSSDPIVRDHRGLSGFGGNGAIVRDHRGDTTTVLPPKGTGGITMPPGTVVVDPVHPSRRPGDAARPPFGIFDPGTVIDPVRPPKGPTGGIHPPFGGGVFDPGTGSGTTTPPSQPDPPSQPMPPVCPPSNGGSCGQGNGCYNGGFPWWALGSGLLNGGSFGGSYGGGYGGSYAAPSYAAPAYATQSVGISDAVAAEPTVTADSTLPQLAPGDEASVNATNLGTSAGKAAMRIGDLMLPVEVRQWSDSSVVILVPQMLVTKPTEAELLIARADGTAATSVSFELVMPSSAALAGK